MVICFEEIAFCFGYMRNNVGIVEVECDTNCVIDTKSDSELVGTPGRLRQPPWVQGDLHENQRPQSILIYCICVVVVTKWPPSSHLHRAYL